MEAIIIITLSVFGILMSSIAIALRNENYNLKMKNESMSEEIESYKIRIKINETQHKPFASKEETELIKDIINTVPYPEFLKKTNTGLY